MAMTKFKILKIKLYTLLWVLNLLPQCSSIIPREVKIHLSKYKKIC